LGAITDDTQMTLFTAEGALRAQRRYEVRGLAAPAAVIHHALLRWLYTQGERNPALREPPDGWLIRHQELFEQRAPGTTCLSSLRAATRLGEEVHNDRKGCGAVMRIAPIGLFMAAGPRAYEIACASARSTHGHPDSTYSSGFFALVIAHLSKGHSLASAMAQAKPALEAEPNSANVLGAIAQAEELAHSAIDPTPEVVEQLGQGWVAEEALAVSLFCALRAESFEHGVRLAVNHSGDSDSTGSLTGQLLGTLLGVEAIPKHWLDAVELRDILETLAADLAGESDASQLRRRYPAW